MTNTLNKKQLGVTLLLLTLTLLLISTLILLFATQFSVLQQKISGNVFKNQQAFEAAQAGLEASIPYFKANYTAIVAAASNGYLTPYMNANTQNVTLTNNSKYTFVFTNPTANNYQLITVTSTGANQGGSATRTITQQLQAYASSITPPTISLQTQGNISLSNSASLNNSTTNSNINAGGSITFKNSSSTTTNAGVTSNSSQLGSDVQQNNGTLASMSSSNFFQSVFGTSTAAVQSNASYVYNKSGSDSFNFLNGVTGSIIWINESGTASINGTTVIGSPSSPVIMVVNGNINFSGSVIIYGFVFIFNSSSGTSFSNSATINGALASSNALSFSNSASVNYNSAILNSLPSVGTASNYAKVPASWRDF